MLNRDMYFRGKNFPKLTKKNQKELVCHKCRSPYHYIKFFPLQALEKNRNNQEKAKEIENDKYIHKIRWLGR